MSRISPRPPLLCWLRRASTAIVHAWQSRQSDRVARWPQGRRTHSVLAAMEAMDISFLGCAAPLCTAFPPFPSLTAPEASSAGHPGNEPRRLPRRPAARGLGGVARWLARLNTNVVLLLLQQLGWGWW